MNPGGLSFPEINSMITNRIGKRNYDKSPTYMIIGMKSITMNNPIPKYHPFRPNVFLKVSV